MRSIWVKFVYFFNLICDLTNCVVHVRCAQYFQWGGARLSRRFGFSIQIVLPTCKEGRRRVLSLCIFNRGYEKGFWIYYASLCRFKDSFLKMYFLFFKKAYGANGMRIFVHEFVFWLCYYSSDQILLLRTWECA